MFLVFPKVCWYQLDQRLYKNLQTECQQIHVYVLLLAIYLACDVGLFHRNALSGIQIDWVMTVTEQLANSHKNIHHTTIHVI